MSDRKKEAMFAKLAHSIADVSGGSLRGGSAAA